jgi:glyoxylase-like metal-dependent hydrolase (beta-lactamase superfamily II)
MNAMLICEKSGQAALVDPFDADYWQQVAASRGIVPTQLLLTHTHADHTAGLKDLRTSYPEMRIWVHQRSADRGWNGPDTDRWNHPANESVIFQLGQLEFEIHHTPGHAPGHCTIHGHGLVLAGDLLFTGRCGRIDLLGGDAQAMWASIEYIRRVLKSHPPDWMLIPGHRYEFVDGTNPDWVTVGAVLESNQALHCTDFDQFNGLHFIRFDDHLAA